MKNILISQIDNQKLLFLDVHVIKIKITILKDKTKIEIILLNDFRVIFGIVYKVKVIIKDKMKVMNKNTNK